MNSILGNKALDFVAPAVMPNNDINEQFTLSKYLEGKKGVLFFYPLDFTFVCPSEIIAFHNRLGEFTSRNTKVIAASIDSVYCHLAWKNTKFNEGGIDNVQFPIVSDLNKEIAKHYNILNQDGVTFRCTVIIDEDFVVRHMSINDLPLGRNVDEIIRLLDGLDHHKKYGEVCPAGWQKGDNAIAPDQYGIADYLSSNAEKL